MKIMITTEIDDDLGPMLLQHIRDFDQAHPGCLFQIAVNAPELSIEEMKELLNVDPPFAHTATMRKQ